jgi:ketosteroid isomerase-like protein
VRADRFQPQAPGSAGCARIDFIMSEERNLEVARRVAEGWNAGDLDAVLALFHDDTVSTSGPDWPDPGWHDKDQLSRYIDDWRSTWQSVQLELQSLEAFGDKVLARGAWMSRGRVSGVAGELPFSLVFTLRDGKIAQLEWFTDHDDAVAAARAS